MPTTRYRGSPMTLANMRANGMRSFGPRMVCTCCGIIGADVRPNWSERPQSESLTGWQWR